VVAHEPPAVAEAGQGVGERLLARVMQHREVREEGHAEAPDDREQRGPGQPDREEIEAAEVVRDEQHEPEQRERERDDEHAPALERAGADVLRRQPCCPREQQGGGRPAGLEHRAGLPRAGRVAP
jgi:hypothetical protein